MSVFAGKNGYIIFDGQQIVNANGWTVEMKADMAESTPMSGTRVTKGFVFGDIEWKASVTAYMEDNASNVFIEYLGADTAYFYLELYFKGLGGTAFKGYAVLTDISTDATVDGVGAVNLSFQGIPSANGVGLEII